MRTIQILHELGLAYNWRLIIVPRAIWPCDEPVQQLLMKHAWMVSMSEIPSFWVSRLQVLLNSGGQNPFSDGAVKVWIKDIIRTKAQQHPALEHHSAMSWNIELSEADHMKKTKQWIRRKVTITFEISAIAKPCLTRYTTSNALE